MMLFALAFSALLPAVVLATYTVHQVNVGANGKLEYEPDYVNAHPGDVVRFNFFPKNHTVTQSSFDNPCVPLADGLNSGFVPVAPDAIGKVEPYFVLVKDYSPLWFHCQQPNPAPGHCVNGMVFAINPPPALLANYRASAKVVAAREVENGVDGPVWPWREGSGENTRDAPPPWREGNKEDTRDAPPPWREGSGKNARDAPPPWREGTSKEDTRKAPPPWREATGEDTRDAPPPWREGNKEDTRDAPPPWREGNKEDTRKAPPPWREAPKEDFGLA